MRDARSETGPLPRRVRRMRTSQASLRLYTYSRRTGALTTAPEIAGACCDAPNPYFAMLTEAAEVPLPAHLNTRTHSHPPPHALMVGAPNLTRTRAIKAAKQTRARMHAIALPPTPPN
eukprot:683944-Pleurochrysis_carterae.AAC.1